MIKSWSLSHEAKWKPRLVIDLPEAGGDPVEEPPEALELLVTKEGTYSLNGQSLINREIRTIMAALQDASGGNMETPLIITADAKATHQSVITAMDAAGRMGFTKLNIATQQPEE